MVTALPQLVGHCLLESECGGYVMAVDDGSIGVGPPRPHDAAPDSLPDPTEIVTVVAVTERKIALKTAYGRYITLEADGSLAAKTEAMGVRELWEPVLLDSGEVLLRGHTKGYLTAAPGAPAHGRSEVWARLARLFGCLLACLLAWYLADLRVCFLVA